MNLRSACLLACALLLIACSPWNDGAYYAQQARKEADRRERLMRLSTAQVERGERLHGKALVAFLSGRSFGYRYGSFPDGSRGDYVVYRHFNPDGRFIAVDNHLHNAPNSVDGDAWSVDGERLCVLHQWVSSTPQCYAAAVDARGGLQLYIDDPASQFHGLLTSVSNEIIDGPPPSLAARAR